MPHLNMFLPLQWQAIRALLEQHQKSRLAGDKLSPAAPRKLSAAAQEALDHSMRRVRYSVKL